MSSEYFQDGGYGGSGISELSNFSSSGPPCHSDALNHVSIQTNLQNGRKCGLKNFKMGAMAAIWGEK